MIAFSWNPDLSTLASVVSSLAGMRSDAFGAAAAAAAGLGLNHRGAASPVERSDRSGIHERSASGTNLSKMDEDEDSEDEDSASTNNDDQAAVANALHIAKENLISKAFDTMAKVRYFFIRGKMVSRYLRHFLAIFTLFYAKSIISKNGHQN